MATSESWRVTILELTKLYEIKVNRQCLITAILFHPFMLSANKETKMHFHSSSDYKKNHENLLLAHLINFMALLIRGED